MSPELTNFYRSLADDTDGRGLAAPELVRRRADRRAWTRAATGALAVAVLAAGTAVGAQLVLAADRRTPVGPSGDTSPAPSVSPAPSSSSPVPRPSPSTPPAPPSSPSRAVTSAPQSGGAPPTARTPTSVPDRAFFVLAAANDTGMTPAFLAGPVLPELCDADPGASGIVQRRARTLAFKLADTPPGYVPDGSYRHSVTIYRAGRAGDALAELRRAVRDCPTQPASGGGEGLTSTQRLLPDAGYGDESVLFELRRPAADHEGAPAVEEVVRLVRAVRVGDVVTVLWEQGWEGTSSPRSQVDADSRRAVAAVRDWWK
ncbi:hypothetical protein [Micromonospora psammae]|uniref:hypothetical protein n=1 Tax=Micromonospora sp. CPCC 205556 TaxID=3122398 RepID=UPI002FF3FCCD